MTEDRYEGVDEFIDFLRGLETKYHLQCEESNSLTRRRDSKPQESRTFHRFSDLPCELRILIWKYAAPPPRLIEIKVKSSQLGTMLVSSGKDRDVLQEQTVSFPKYVPAEFIYSPLLYTCHESRQVQLRTSAMCMKSTIDPDARFYGGPCRHSPLLCACWRITAQTSSWIKSLFSTRTEPRSPSDDMPCTHTGSQLLPHDAFSAPGFLFHPRRDTIYLPFSREMQLSLHTLPRNTVRLADIRSVAVDVRLVGTALFWQGLIGGRPAAEPRFPRLREVIVVLEKYNYSFLTFSNIRSHVRRLLDQASPKRRPTLRLMSRVELMHFERWRHGTPTTLWSQFSYSGKDK